MLRTELSRRCIAVAALLLALIPWSSALPEKNSVPNELLRSWSLEDITKETPPYRAKGRVYVLAWKVIQDERPMRVESCLVLKVLEKDEGYCLAHLYRHPNTKEPAWQLSQTHVKGKKGTKYYPGMELFHCKVCNRSVGW